MKLCLICLILAVLKDQFDYGVLQRNSDSFLLSAYTSFEGLILIILFRMFNLSLKFEFQPL